MINDIDDGIYFNPVLLFIFKRIFFSSINQFIDSLHFFFFIKSIINKIQWVEYETVNGNDILINPSEYQLPVIDGLDLRSNGKYAFLGGTYLAQGSLPCARACRSFNELNPSSSLRCRGAVVENDSVCSLKSSVVTHTIEIR